jgi:hypothetical protein
MACIPHPRRLTIIMTMRILAVFTDDYGVRHIANLRLHAPPSWEINEWRSPTNFPIVIDDPADFIPAHLPPTDLLLSFAEHKGVVELLPDLAQISGAKAVLAPVDSEAWLPRGLARQLHGWLENIGVACATPKPLCSLTETDYLVTRRQRHPYSDPYISAFARHFGQPNLLLAIDPQTNQIIDAQVHRDAVCGCARHVAQQLVGVSVDEAEYTAGMAHHHYPCLASMGIDSDFGDTLMHISGNLIKDNVAGQVRPLKKIQYIAPGFRTSDADLKKD